MDDIEIKQIENQKTLKNLNFKYGYYVSSINKESELKIKNWCKNNTKSEFALKKDIFEIFNTRRNVQEVVETYMILFKNVEDNDKFKDSWV